jgi:ABC-type transport system involved in cytochrome c biogenesis permease component
LSYPAGTPTIWFVMFMALATRWPWWSALILAKPTLLPFGLVGVRSRNWWIAASVLALATLAMWSLTMTWVGVVFDQRGSGLLYSVLNVPFMLIPLVAAAKRWPFRIGYPKLSDTRGTPAGLPPSAL